MSSCNVGLSVVSVCATVVQCTVVATQVATQVHPDVAVLWSVVWALSTVLGVFVSMADLSEPLSTVEGLMTNATRWSSYGHFGWLLGWGLSRLIQRRSFAELSLGVQYLSAFWVAWFLGAHLVALGHTAVQWARETW